MNLQTLYRPLALLVVVSLLLAGTFTGAGRNASADSNNAGEPAGQFTRRGVTGEVVSAGGGSIAIETRFGNVTIDVPGGTIIKSKGETIELGDIKPGDRAGVLLDRAPDVLRVKESDDDDEDGDAGDIDLSAPSTGDDTGTDPDLTPTPVSDDTGVDPDSTATPTLTPPDSSDDTGTDPDLVVPSNLEGAASEPDVKPPAVESFRQSVSALRITVVSAPTRKHECVVVTSIGDGTTSVLDDEGNETELEGDAGVEGEDVCLLTRRKKGGGKEITGSIGSNAVDERLARMAERNEALAEKLAEKKAEVEAKRQERLDRTVNNTPEDKKSKAEGARSSNQNRGSGGGNSDKGGSPPEDKGKPDNENKGKTP